MHLATWPILTSLIFLCLFLGTPFPTLAVANNTEEPISQSTPSPSSSNNSTVRSEQHVTELGEVQGDGKDLSIYWNTKLSTDIISSPVIGQLFLDQSKQIIIAGTSLITLLDSKTGIHLPGWPVSLPSSVVIANPLIYDINMDGYDDILICTSAADIIFLDNHGNIIPGTTLRLPTLEVPRDYHENKVQPIHNKNNSSSVNRSAKTENQQKKEGSGAQRAKIETIEEQEHHVGDENDDSSSTEKMLSKNFWKQMGGSLTKYGLEGLQWILEIRPIQSVDQLHLFHSDHYINWLKKHPDHFQKPNLDSIFVDPHIVSTPVIADLDGDGSMELIVAVNYYFSQSATLSTERIAQFPPGTNFDNYLACGIVVFNLDSMEILWQTKLELTTRHATAKAYIYFSPTVIDLNRDGKLDIVVATGTGSVYVLDHNGLSRKVPLIDLDSISSGVLAGDFKGDGKIDLLIVDDSGNVICFEPDGSVLWENKVSSSSDHPPMVGDVNGDGRLDVAISSRFGHIWVFDANTGESVPNFPVTLSSTVQSALTLLPFPYKNLDNWKDHHGLSILVHGTGGITYIINGETGEVNSIDLGETSYSMILADDLRGDQSFDILLSTYEGSVYCLKTNQTMLHRASAWKSQLNGRNSFTSGLHQGVQILKKTISRTEIYGDTFYVSFEIIDHRTFTNQHPSYTIYIRCNNFILMQKNYSSPGIYTEKLNSPSHPTFAIIKLEMVNEHGQAFFDSMGISFNNKIISLLKWLIDIPFLVMSICIIYMKEVQALLP